MQNKFEYTSEELQINKVLKKHQGELSTLTDSSDVRMDKLTDAISSSEALSAEIGSSFSAKGEATTTPEKETPIFVSTFEKIVDEAEKEYFDTAVLEDIFTSREISDNSHYISALRKEFYDLSRLDMWDYTVAGIAGTVAALLDFFLVTKVHLETGAVSSGALKSGVEKLWDKVLPPEKIKLLEKASKVPFDISTNTSKISQEVLGLSPNYHRFQSLGHDPLLGFIFGIKDSIKCELTAIDGNGRLIIQAVSGAKTMKFVEAVVKQFAHLLSDVSALSDTGKRLSIPAPLMPLLQMVQNGSVAYNSKTYKIGDLVKKMYYDGYNFNHFIGMNIPIVMIEIIVRLYLTLRDVFSDTYNKNKHKNDLMLFVANSILCAENIRKVIVTENPFAIN